jgi:hypothetical protein
VTQAVEHLPGKLNGLSSNPSPAKTQNTVALQASTEMLLTQGGLPLLVSYTVFDIQSAYIYI